MEDTTSERQKSLEELLQDVEFECPGVTLNENVKGMFVKKRA